MAHMDGSQDRGKPIPEQRFGSTDCQSSPESQRSGKDEHESKLTSTGQALE